MVFSKIYRFRFIAFVFIALLLFKAPAHSVLCSQCTLADGQRKFSYSLYAESGQDFERVLQKNPTHKTALTMAGWSYFKQSRFDLALAKFSFLLQQDAKSEDALEGLGWTYFKTAQYYNALQSFEALHSKNKNHVGAVEGVAYTKFKLGDYTGAKKGLALALLHNPLSSDTHSILGYIAIAEANYKDAVKHFKSANQLSKEPNADLLTALGNAYLGIKKPRCAKCVFKKALKVYPQHPGALAGLAQIR